MSKSQGDRSLHLQCPWLREVKLYSFLTLALQGGEWSASIPGHSIPGEKLPVTIKYKAQWFGQQIWTIKRGKKLCLCQKLNNYP